MDMAKSIPPLMCNTPPPMDDSFEDEDEVSIVESIEDDSSAPSTPSKHKSIENDLPVPDELPPVIQPLAKTPITNTKQPPDDSNFNPIALNEPDDTHMVRSESPPSLDLQDPQVTDGSFDDPNMDEIPEDELYSNTDLSLPSLQINSIVTPTLEVCTNVPTTEFTVNRNEDSVSLNCADIPEDDFSVCEPSEQDNDYIGNVDIKNNDENDVHCEDILFQSTPIISSDSNIPHDSPPPDQSLNINEVTCGASPPNGSDLNDSFDDFVEYSANTDLNSNKLTSTAYQDLTGTTNITDAVNQLSSDPTPLQSSTTYTSSAGEEHNVIDCEIESDFMFTADFSQFNAFESDSKEQVTNITTSVSETSHALELEDNDDDFGDFNDVPMTVNHSAAPVSISPVNQPLDQNDDDFGDFSDFQTTESSISIVKTDIKDVCANVASLLAMMFPITDPVVDTTETLCKTMRQTEDLLSEITLAVRSVDDSKALQHQWLTSKGKSSLVKALGIDARNILYGGKWNSSMPRFAANLGFNPLEPMKPELAPGVRSSEIPAAQFDWSSSGLVNPLDASHAPQHSLLLLDLDQLVVVSANLDNITLASSAAYSDGRRSSSSSPTRVSEPTFISPENIHYSSTPSHNISDTTQSKTNSSCLGSTGCTPDLLGMYDLRRGQFDHFLDSRVQEIIHEANVAKNRSPRTDTDWPVRQQHGAETTHLSSGPAAAQSAPFQLNATTASHIADDYADVPSPTSSSYVVPGSGTLKETHIFTPSKMIVSTSPKQSISDELPRMVKPDSDMINGLPESGIRIDENVVKKEYRDIEYNPNLTTTTTSDDFSDFQSMAPPNTVHCLQPIQSGVVINWPDPGSVTSVEMGSFDDFVSTDSYQPTIHEDKSIHNHSTTMTSGDGSSLAKNAELKMLENHAIYGITAYKKEDKEMDNIKPQEPANIVKTVTNFDELYDLTKLPELHTTYINEDSTPTFNHNLSNGFSSIHSTNSVKIHSFSNFQNVPIPAKPETLTPTMMQPIEPTPVLVPNRTQTSNISWPDPGIDADEMARLEAIFPTPKTISLPKPSKIVSPKGQISTAVSEEVEWTDFVSSSAGFQPITHIINQSILKHQQEKPVVDDDDWSDFMSGGTQASNQFSPLKMATGSAGNFPAWNAAPSHFGSWSTSPSTSNVFSSTIPSSLPPKESSPNRTPNISLIPDLGFVAPPFNRGSATNSSGRSGSNTLGSARK